jgi:hypothetical protein
VSVVRLIVATRSSCKEMPGSVASGTPCISQQSGKEEKRRTRIQLEYAKGEMPLSTAGHGWENNIKMNLK